MDKAETLKLIDAARAAALANSADLYVLSLIYVDVVGYDPTNDDNETAEAVFEALMGYLHEWQADISRSN